MRYLGFIVILLLSFTTLASEVTVPNTFVAGEKAIAEDVNINFSELADGINDNNSRINSNAAVLTEKQNQITQECSAGAYIQKINQNGTVVCDTDNVNSGDITSVNTAAGSGLTGGSESGAADLAVDTSVIQLKLSGSACTDDNYVKSIAANGTTVCSAPSASTGDITSVTTAVGSGLTGGVDSGPANLAVDTNVIQSKLSGSACTGDNYVKSIAANGITVCSAPPASTGDITAVSTAVGSGLTGGVESGAANLAVDITAIQKRITGICAIGQVVTQINENGTVICNDAPTDIVAGTGLTRSINTTTKAVTLNADSTYIQRRLNSACGPGSSIRDIALDGTPTCELDVDTDTTYSAGAGIVFSSGTTINTSVGAAITVDPPTKNISSTNFNINTVVQVSITVPSAGYVLITHKGHIVTFGTPNEIEVGIGDTATAMDASVRVGVLETATNRYELAYDATFLYSTSASGTYAYYGLAQKNTVFNAGSINVIPQSLTALFIPTKY